MNAPLNVPHALCACEKRGGKLKDKCSQRGQELCLCCAVLKDLGGPDRLFTLLPASKLTTGSVCQVAVVSKFNLSWHLLLLPLMPSPSFPSLSLLASPMAYIYAAPLANKLHPPSPCIVHTLSPSIILYTYTPVRPAAGAAAAATQQHGRRFGEAGGGDGGCAGDVRRREHILQAGGVGRHGHEGAGGLPLPLRLRLPGAPRLLHREVSRRCSSGLRRLHGR